jgi:hypothetical protein
VNNFTICSLHHIIYGDKINGVMGMACSMNEIKTFLFRRHKLDIGMKIVLRKQGVHTGFICVGVDSVCRHL